LFDDWSCTQKVTFYRLETGVGTSGKKSAQRRVDKIKPLQS
jgi:hypothetical protein